jgi:hypothetical protein
MSVCHSTLYFLKANTCNNHSFFSNCIEIQLEYMITWYHKKSIDAMKINYFLSDPIYPKYKFIHTSTQKQR